MLVGELRLRAARRGQWVGGGHKVQPSCGSGDDGESSGGDAGQRCALGNGQRPEVREVRRAFSTDVAPDQVRMTTGSAEDVVSVTTSIVVHQRVFCPYCVLYSGTGVVAGSVAI